MRFCLCVHLISGEEVHVCMDERIHISCVCYGQVARKGRFRLNQIQSLVEILMMSLALGMDALSLCIGIGLGAVSRKTAIQLCICIGVFHVSLTFLGLVFGNLIGHYLGQLAMWFGAFLVIGLGVHMLYHTLFKKEESPRVLNSVMAMLLFSASVSLDAMSVGFSLGLRSATYGVISAISFGVVSVFMCGAGLMIGKKFGNLIGQYGEIIGAIVLIGCGVKFLV